MKVQELIEKLNRVEDKTKPVKVYLNNEIFDIGLVDLNISDRVDLNIEPNIYFRKYWEQETLEVIASTGTTYYVEVYPLDITDNDTIVVRAYTDKTMTSDTECGNGIWLDSSFGCIEGNNELYFEEDSGKDSIVETEILKAVEKKLQEEGIINE